MSGRNRDNLSSRRRQVSKMLVFEDDGHKSVDVVDLSDSETEERNEKESDVKNTLEEKSVDESYEDEDVEACESNTNTRKRKRVINSDSENDDEDNIPLSILKNLKPLNQEVSDLVGTPSIGENESKRLSRVSSRLRKQRVLEETTTPSKRLVGIPTTGNAVDDETEEEESGGESESESLDGFIVDDDVDESASEKSDENHETEGGVEEEESDGEIGYADIMSRLRRDKDKWEYQTDMLSAFGKDDELCMRAVCVLYMFQTEDEKAARSSHVANGRGFSMFDAERGTLIGQFLTDGDPAGDLKKSVEELQSFKFDALEICRDLAVRYSKQLFQIYNNREVQFFAAPPSP
ncbi:unnamed protein product [Thlaspi arvense]|uniref:Uncharacterized protein n=1 Tax=Thlaspi arvense TaxID=13288 RepID=A0AAU9SNJ4_THLAR|nr:unnamed protein product [Thlaspi arvense]